MADFKVKTIVGDLEVVYSGECHMQRDSQNLSIKLNDTLTLNFKFLTDDNNKANTINIRPLEDNPTEGDFEIINFNSALGSGILEPILIGDIDDKLVYFTFFTWKYEDGRRRLQYTLYLGNNKKNGKSE